MNAITGLLHRNFARVTFAVAGTVFSIGASAVPYYYVDWTAWNPGAGTAAGTITPSSGPDVTVNFDAITSTGTNGSYLGVTTGLWTPTTTYTSSQVDNASTFEALQLVGTSNMTYRVTLSEAIKDPIMAVTTLGSGSDSATYVFDSPFTILSQGPTCCWGGGTDRLTQSGYVLTGWEGAGTIQFIGTYSTFSWTVPDPEYWHGFTFGIRTTEALEPTPPSTNVPEPASLALVGSGLATLAALAWLRRRRIQATI